MSRIEEILARDGRLVYKIKGVSMLPMLRQNRDVVQIDRPTGRLKKYDVALYKQDGRFVLHRVIRIREDGYLIRGDNTYALEDVPDGAVIGVLTKFKRNGREYAADHPAWQCYARLWCALYPLRRLTVKGIRFLKRVGKRLLEE